MSELLVTQQNRLQEWAKQASSEGWLPTEAHLTLAPAKGATPGQLFETTDRPLVAGLFGGTGVGKSTLLNRLAGQVIARASSERPTSRDITLYVHESVSVDRLPDEFPMQRMLSAKHGNDQYRQILFIDMPDFDSVEQSNRTLVDQWVPHLDVVMYVVSPERYRDELGWQLMQQHASEHAWLFIINQWDRGDEAQREDFISMLKARGLAEPLVFCTDCANPQHAPGKDISSAQDDFGKLQKSLITLSEKQIVRALQEHGVLARLQQLKRLSQPWLDSFGDQQLLDDLPARWSNALDKQVSALQESVQLPILQTASTHAEDTPFWQRLFGKGNAGRRQYPTEAQLNVNSVHATLNERLNTFLTQFANQQAHTGALPLKALNAALFETRESLNENCQLKLQNALGNSLMRPGRRWQRTLDRVLSKLCLLLPVAALGWISLRVVSGFIAGSNDPSAYLSGNFAVNSLFLLALSWLLPALARTYLKPAAEKAAHQGLSNGVSEVIKHVEQQVFEQLSSLSARATDLRTSYQSLWSEWPDKHQQSMPEAVKRILSKAMMDTPTGSGDSNRQGTQIDGANRTLDVRANTHNSTDSAPLS